MANTKKSSKKRLLRRKTKKHETKQAKPQSNDNPAAGMSRLEYQQALMDPRFRAAMIGFNGSVGMGSQQSAQLRELEMKSNDIIRNINFQEQKMNLAKNLEEKKKEQRKLEDDYEEQQMMDKYHKELEGVKSNVKKIQMKATHQEEIGPLNDQLSNMKDEDDIKQQERRYKEESSKLKHETAKRSRMQQMQAELDVLKEQKDKAQSEYERSELERQYRDKRKQYEMERDRLEAGLNYANQDLINRAKSAAIDADIAEKDLEMTKHIAELKDRANKAFLENVEKVATIIGPNFDPHDRHGISMRLNAERNKAITEIADANNIARDVKDVEDTITESIKARRDSERAWSNFMLYRDHRIDPRLIASRDKAIVEITNANNIARDVKDVEDTITESIKAKRDSERALKKVISYRDHRVDQRLQNTMDQMSQEIETKRLQTEEVKRLQGDIQSAINDKGDATWTAKKTFDDLLAKNSSIRSIASRVAISKRGKPDPDLEDWPEIQEELKGIDSDMHTALNKISGRVGDSVIRAQEHFISLARQSGIDVDKALENNRKMDKMFRELQERARQADRSKQLKGMYATVLSSIYDKLPNDDARDSFIAEHFTDPRIMTQIVADTTEYNNGTYPLNDPTITLNDPDISPNDQ